MSASSVEREQASFQRDKATSKHREHWRYSLVTAHPWAALAAGGGTARGGGGGVHRGGDLSSSTRGGRGGAFPRPSLTLALERLLVQLASALGGGGQERAERLSLAALPHRRRENAAHGLLDLRAGYHTCRGRACGWVWTHGGRNNLSTRRWSPLFVATQQLHGPLAGTQRTHTRARCACEEQQGWGRTALLSSGVFVRLGHHLLREAL
jgi:hypothetical protein